MRHKLSILGGFLLTLAVVATPFVYRTYLSVEYRNFRVVEPGRIYRSGQMTESGFRRMVTEHRIGTVISLRDTKDEFGNHEDCAEEKYCREQGLGFHRVPPPSWTPIEGVIPGDELVTRFLTILNDPQTRYPVLVHCFAGIHRTGAFVATHRMQNDHWTADEAIAEMLSMGTPRTTFAPDVLEYLRSYRPKPIGPPSR